MENIIIGIDIAKYKFDVAIVSQNKTTNLQFKNCQEGF
ncbi:MAG: IS110 family transposase [Candidatus Midichloria sp.]|nr:IS110 family transposase [Candidatus Midichloria sp.]